VDKTNLPLPKEISACLLAGGEGRRMQGMDKGLVPYQGQALATCVLDKLAPQVDRLGISANRNLAAYQALLHSAQAKHPFTQQAVRPDDTDLPEHSGPLAGILTALRHTDTPWLMVVPCDTPHLPDDLVERLMQQAMLSQSDIVIPETRVSPSESRFHWVCALIHKRVCPQTEAAFMNGERKVGRWIQSQKWSSVFFTDPDAFNNINTLETLNGRH
jgi:molybdenum cofactor guanylyltransferase